MAMGKHLEMGILEGSITKMRKSCYSLLQAPCERYEIVLFPGVGIPANLCRSMLSGAQARWRGLLNHLRSRGQLCLIEAALSRGIGAVLPLVKSI